MVDGPVDPVPGEGRDPSISRLFWGLNRVCPRTLFSAPPFQSPAFDSSEGILQFPEMWQPAAGPRHITLAVSLWVLCCGSLRLCHVGVKWRP